MGSVVGFLADLLSILSVFKDPKDLLAKLKELSKRQKVIGISILLLVAGIAYLVWFCISGGSSPTITQVTLSEYSLDMNTGDTGILSATVLYSDNSKGDDVLWVSSNEAVIQINEDGQITALAAGNSTITAQASNRRSTEWAECVVTVTDPLKGYSIFVQRTVLDNYVYIYIQPKDDRVSKITLYARAPSGAVYTPPIDENDLYRFYSEIGTWTIFAFLESENSTYEAHIPEDFATIEINDISATAFDAALAGLPVS